MRPSRLLAAALLAAAAGWQLATRSAMREAARARAAEARLAALTDSLARVEAWMGTTRANEAASLIDPTDLDLLRRRGLADPLRQLRDSLLAHPELIPFKGVLGGTMGFYDTTRVVPLDGRWVYAALDDGHIGDSGLFEFRVLPGGRMAWKRLAARLHE